MSHVKRERRTKGSFPEEIFPAVRSQRGRRRSALSAPLTLLRGRNLGKGLSFISTRSYLGSNLQWSTVYWGQFRSLESAHSFELNAASAGVLIARAGSMVRTVRAKRRSVLYREGLGVAAGHLAICQEREGSRERARMKRPFPPVRGCSVPLVHGPRRAVFLAVAIKPPTAPTVASGMTPSSASSAVIPALRSSGSAAA